MSKPMTFIDYDFDYEVITKSQELPTDCAAITLVNLGNCSVTIRNNGSIPIGGGISISFDAALGIPRLKNKISIVFNDDNTETPLIREVAVTRTLIISICNE